MFNRYWFSVVIWCDGINSKSMFMVHEFRGLWCSSSFETMEFRLSGSPDLRSWWCEGVPCRRDQLTLMPCTSQNASDQGLMWSECWLQVHLFWIYFKMCNFKFILKYLANFFTFLIINSLLQSVQANRENIDTCNFVNCSILPYSISTFKLNGSAEALSLATLVLEYGCRIGGDLGAVLDQYLVEKSWKYLSRKRGMFPTMICHKGP